MRQLISTSLIIYTLKKCATSEEIRQYFYDLNDNIPIPDSVLTGSFADTRTKIIRYFNTKYPKHISSSINAKYPRFHMDKMISYIFDNLPEDSRSRASDAIFMTELWNSSLQEKLRSNFPERWRQANDLQSCYLAHLLTKSEYRGKSRS